MRGWIWCGLLTLVCGAAGGGSSEAQECSKLDPVDRTGLELARSASRPAPRARAMDGPGGRSFDMGQIAVLEDDGAGELIYQTRFGDTTIDLMAIGRRFYRSHPDDYDFLTVFTSFHNVDPISEAPFSAYSLVLNNDIKGIHLPNIDYSAEFGSAGNLEGVLNMNNFADPRYMRGPYDRLPGNNDHTMSLLAHETGHRWGARVQVDEDPGPGVRRSDALLGRGLSHWSFYLHAPTLFGASSLEGNYWQFNGDGTFSTVGETDGYSALDHYLMGLRAPEEVPPFWVVDGERTLAAEEAPAVGLRQTGLPRWFTVGDIIAAEGRRFAGQRSAAGAWRQAFVLVVPRGFPDEHPEELEALVQRLDAVRQEWEYYFFESTERRGMMYTDLKNEPGPLFRLYWPEKSVHFYTMSPSEAFYAAAFQGFTLEGTAGTLFPTQAAGTVPLYRLYHPRVPKHFYTADPYEREGAIQQWGFVPEGVVGYLYPKQIPGTVPLYRMYHHGVADHFYTTGAAEVETAKAAGYVEEAIVGYVLPDEAIGER